MTDIVTKYNNKTYSVRAANLQIDFAIGKYITSAAPVIKQYGLWHQGSANINNAILDLKQANAEWFFGGFSRLAAAQAER